MLVRRCLVTGPCDPVSSHLRRRDGDKVGQFWAVIGYRVSLRLILLARLAVFQLLCAGVLLNGGLSTHIVIKNTQQSVPQVVVSRPSAGEPKMSGEEK